MGDIYNHKKNINIVTTPRGDKVITLTGSILTEICNHLYDAAERQKEMGLTATAGSTMELWKVMMGIED